MTTWEMREPAYVDFIPKHSTDDEHRHNELLPPLDRPEKVQRSLNDQLETRQKGRSLDLDSKGVESVVTMGMAIPSRIWTCVALLGILIAAFLPMTAKLLELKEDIARRLRPVLLDLPEAEFRALIEQIAEIQYKYEQRRRVDMFDLEEPAG